MEESLYFNGEDRISRLPDELIHKILAFIETKYAVQTSVLSKRWIGIWKSLPYLKFDRSSFSEENDHSFIMFVDMVFNFRKDFDIRRLRLRWRKSADDNSVMMNVNRWIIQAVKYNVQALSIFIPRCHDSPYEIPPDLLNCKSLRMLEMKVRHGEAKYADIVLPGSMNLPRLEELILSGMSISDVESSRRLFSSCPVLETLEIVDCNIQTDIQRKLVVDSLSLKEFVYQHVHRNRYWKNNTMANIIKLSAPNLEVFVCTSFMTQDYILENCYPISSVRFCMKLKTCEKDDNAATYSKLTSEERKVYAIRAMKFLGAVYMVKAMKILPGFLEALSQAPDLLDCQPPRLCNLTHLTLRMWSTSGSLRAIAYLLKISPHMTQLNIIYKESNLADVGDDWEAGMSSPGMISHLEEVRIENVDGCANELKFLSFLFEKAKVLKNVVMYPRSTIDSPDSMRNEFINKLRALPRASSHIKIHWPATKSTDLILKTQDSIASSICHLTIH